MSLEAITWAYRTQVGSATRKAVLLVLANYADAEDASSYPSRGHIERMTELKATAVKDALRDLAEMGVIVIEPQERRDGSSTSNRYQLNLGWGSSDDPPGSGNDPSPRSPGDPQGSGGDPRTNTKSTRKSVEPQEGTRAERAERRTPSKRPSKSKGGLRQAEADDGTELASNAFPADGEPEPEKRKRIRPLPRPRRLTSAWLSHVFQTKIEDTLFPEPQKVVTGGLATNLAKWHREGTRYEDIEEALRLFFISPESHHRGTGPVWRSFVNALPDLLTRVTRKSMHDPDYYSDQKKENREMTREEYLEHLNAELR